MKWAEIRNIKLDGQSKYVYKSATPAQLTQIKKQLDDANIKLSILDTGIYKIVLPGTKALGDNGIDLNPVQGEYDRQIDLKRAADAAHALGTNRIRIFTFKRVQDPDAIFNRIVENLHKAIESRNSMTSRCSLKMNSTAIPGPASRRRSYSKPFRTAR